MAALSGSAITQNDAFAGFHNLSSSSELKGLNCSFYGQIPYGISAINDGGVAFLKRFGTGVMGVVCQSYGNTEFNRKRLNVGYAMALSQGLEMGCCSRSSNDINKERRRLTSNNEAWNNLFVWRTSVLICTIDLVDVTNIFVELQFWIGIFSN